MMKRSCLPAHTLPHIPPPPQRQRLLLAKNTPVLLFKVFFAMLLLALPFALLAQSSTVKGVITDGRTGLPMSDVSVVVKGTGRGTKTDGAGAYSIEAKSNEVLVFSYAGYEAQEVPVQKQGVVSLALKETNTKLDEVVVIGYGTAKRKDLTGAVSSVSGKQLAAVPVANAAQALQGKIAGVNVTTQDGRPDASVSIRVRGGNSISQSTEPLYIVDGFPVSNITDIPPGQIESVDVLKDASSTAIFGARGANGVIIVTTKNPKGGKLTVSYDAFVQSNQPTKYLPTMNAYNYVAYNWAYAKAISDNYAKAWEWLWGIGNYATTYNNTQGIDYYRNIEAINYSKQAYKASTSQNHTLSISNGNAKTRYLFSMSYNDNDGMKINSWFKRTNAMFKLDQKISDKLTFAVDSRFTNIQRMSNEGTTNGKGSLLSSAYQFRPIATKDVLGQLDDRVNTQLGLYDAVLQDQFNPVALMSDYLPQANERSLRSNASLSWNIIHGLTARTEFGYNLFWNRSKTWSGAVYNNYIDVNGNPTYAGNASISSAEGWSLRWVNTLNYQWQRGSAHTVNVTVGQEVQNTAGESISISGSKYPASFSSERAFGMMNQYYTGGNTVNYSLGSNVSFPNRVNSYFGRVNYSLLDRYLFSATFRADGSSRFATAHKWGMFPGAALAWRLSKESFMKDISWLGDLKVRASYGEVGNDGIGPGLWKMQWTSDGMTRYSVNEAQQSAYSPQSVAPNPDLKWESTVTRNLGVDFTVLNGKFFGTAEFYNNSSKNLLLLASVSPISGFTNMYDNIGSIRNKGIELTLGSNVFRNKDWMVTANFNINFNRSSVQELGRGVTGLYKSQWGSTMTQPSTGDYILQVGKPVGQVRGYTYDGWYTTADFDYSNGIYTLKKGVADIASGIIGTVYGTTANKPGSQTAYPGVIKFKDINGDGVIDEKDVTVIGDMNPKHTGGFSLNTTFKGLDLALNFNWSYGNKVYNANYLAAFYGSKEDGLYRNRLDYLSTSYKIYDIRNGQMTAITNPAELDALNANATTFLPFHENPVVSTLGIQDGSFLRLNTATLGYTLPASLLKKASISRLRVYAAVYNAFTLTKYKGLDPEVNTNTSQGGAQYPTIGLDWGAYPRARSYTVGVNVEF